MCTQAKYAPEASDTQGHRTSVATASSPDRGTWSPVTASSSMTPITIAAVARSVSRPPIHVRARPRPGDQSVDGRAPVVIASEAAATLEAMVLDVDVDEHGRVQFVLEPQ